VWGLCNWIGSGWCAGIGPHQTTGARIYDARQLPHLGDAGQGINRKLPHLSAGRGINRQLPHLSAGRGEHPRSAFIHEWMGALHDRLRDTRVTCGDWGRVVKDSVTTRHGLTGLFLDPPYTKGAMDYAAGGVGTDLPLQVQAWCAEHGDDPKLRIALCGHTGEHDALLEAGWVIGRWKARKGYAVSDEAIANSAGETIWFSPYCIAVDDAQPRLVA
jgi:DNA adenine methylase